MKHSRSSRFLAVLLAVVMVFSMLPVFAVARENGVYRKITSADALTTGKYVLVTDTGYAPGILDAGWVTAEAVTPEGDTLTNPTAVWDITVDGETAKLTDRNGTAIAPKGGNNNGIAAGDYAWTVTCEGGTFRFGGQGEDTVLLASNKGSENKFRAYKTTTVTGNPGGYPSDFTLYKLDGGAPVDPTDPTDPVVTEPTGPAADYVDISVALNGNSGDSFTVKGVVTLVDGNNLYLQDSTGGICLRTTARPEDVSLGDTILGTGKRADYNGLAQLGSGTYEKSEGLTLAAKDTTIGALTEADVCTYVHLTGLTVTEVFDNNGQYASPNITVQDGSGDAIQLYKAVTTKTDGVWDIQPGDVLDVTAAVGIYAKDGNVTLQLRNTLPAELQEVRYAKHTDTLADGDQFVIYYNKDALVMGAAADGNKLTGTAAILDGDFVPVTSDMAVLTAAVDTDGNYTFTDAQGRYLTTGATGNSLTFADAASDYSLWTVKPVAGGVHVVSVKAAYKGSPQALEVYNGLFTTFSEKDTDYYLFNLYKLTDEKPGPGHGPLPEDGDAVMLYNLSAQGVLGLQDDNVESPALLGAAAEIQDGKALAENGGLLFTVEKNGDYYRFHNETFGYLCSNGTGNNAFYQQEAAEDADWTLAEYNGGFTMESRTAKFNGKYSQFLEYYSGSYKTYSMNKVTDKDIFTFRFYETANEALTGGVVNAPAVVFGTAQEAFVGVPYSLTFTVDAVFGVKTLDANYPVTEGDGTYTVTVPAESVVGENLVITVSGTDNKDVAFSGSVTVNVKDEPVISGVTPAPGSETGDNKRPVISAEIKNAGEQPTVTMTVNGEAVGAVYDGETVTYTPAADLPDGRTAVAVTVTRTDGKSAEKLWSFTVGEAAYSLYFGQLHSHTQFSDGAGSLSSALDYIRNLPDSANVDFVAFTDHSNYFDEKTAANPEGALYDMSLATAYSQNRWAEYKTAIADFNGSQSDVVALGGYEMTWSGGPGHMNTWATPGIVSRNNSTLNNKTADAGMRAYYALLSQSAGAESISQFNHPGSTFGTFADFSYWDAMIDSRIYLVEVGNGEGAIGAGGYFPSYEYYTMALDKGWHLAPTNNQDNHKGKWGNGNDARDVILTDDFSEEGIYEAIRNYRVYATEDKNLEIRYTVNDLPLGSAITEVPEKLSVNVQVSDPDSADTITKVEVIVNSGKTAYTWSDPQVLAAGDLRCTLDPTYSYYYIRVTQGDGDLAVTAPVWVGETLKLGISDVRCGTATPVTGEALDITTTLFNSESTEASVKSITYTTGGAEVLYTDTTGYTIPANGTLDVVFAYTPEIARVMTITATAVVELQGEEYTFSMDVKLDVLNADELVYIGIDASHYNEYVAGNYKDSMGNFSALAAGYSVRTVELRTSEELVAACGNDKYKALILTAPSRRLADAQSNPGTYSAAELSAIAEFNKQGGQVILAGWSDNYENYDVITGNPDILHMAATQNAVLEALGSSLRISDDATYDDVRSAADGVDPWRLYFSAYNFANPLTDRVEVDGDHPYDRLYTEVFSHYGGASVYAVDGDGAMTDTLPATVSPVVYGHSTTYSKDIDGDGLGGNISKYAYGDGTDRLLIMASEDIPGQGRIIVSGAAFMSNFEVQATIGDSNAEKNYANYKICENLVQSLNPVKVTDIAEVQAQTEKGYKYTIEGVVTSNASGFDKATAFFDCIYVQDSTGGICCFPVSGDYKVGDRVRVTGTTDFYQGEPELQVTAIVKLGENAPVEPAAVSAAQINDRSVLGSLVTLSGTVQSFRKENGLVQTIFVEDAAGNVARVFIDGYITTDKDVEKLAVGCKITVTGLASYDDTFNAPEGPFPRIRVRNRADVVCEGLTFVDVTEADYFYEAVMYLAEQGIVNGTGENRFQPLRNLSRGEMVTMLYRMAGEPECSATDSFRDVPEGSYYENAIAWAAKQHIAKGYPDGTFRPDQAASREEMAAFLYRFHTHQNGSVEVDSGAAGEYLDWAQVSDYAREAVAWAVDSGLMIGVPGGYLRPRDTAQRCQMTEVLYRYDTME